MTIIKRMGERGDSPLFPQFLVPVFLGLVLMCGSLMAAKPPQQLTPQAERISDGKIQKDRKTFEAMQARVRALNVSGVPLSNYHLAKAEAYLDVALDEYLENDRSSFVELALGEADGLLRGLEAGEKGLSLATYPLDVEKASKAANPAPRMPENRLRPDLWAHAESLKQNEHFSCAAATTAQFEVQLLQAIHEDRIGGWRRTSPYIAIAESLSARAQEALDDCAALAKTVAPPVVIAKEPTPVPPPAPAPPVAIVANPPVVVVAPPSDSPPAPASIPEKPKPLIILSERVFFAFGRADISEAGRSRMREVAAILNTADVRDRRIFVDGYTDNVGNRVANQSLSERRADAVRRALIDNGIDPSRLTARGFGDARPVVANHRPDGTDDPEARAQNRRVELVLEPQ